MSPQLRRRALLLLPLCAAVGRADDTVLTTLPFGPAEATLLRDGRLQLSAGGHDVQRVHVVLAGEEWRGSADQSALVLDGEPRRQNGALAFAATLTDPVAKVAWRFEQRVTVADGKLHLAYQMTPAADTRVGEVSVFFDLPIAGWSGRPVRLWPARVGLFPVQQPPQRHFLAGRAGKVVLDEDATPHLGLSFERRALCTVQDNREFGGDTYQVYVRLFDGGEIQAGQVCRLEVTVDPDDHTTLPKPLRLESAEPLRVGPTTLAAATVPVFGKLEAELDVQGTWATPFDADQIRVDGHLTTPSGRELVVPAFYTVDHELRHDGDDAWVEATGDPHWCLRLTATEPGRHTLSITARDRSGEAKGEPVTFAATPSDDAGFVRVSAEDHHYFAFDNGRPYFAVGENVATGRGGVADFDRWFGRLGQAGANYVRVWMSPGGSGYEWGPPGSYRLDCAAQFDEVLEAARRNGLYIKLCLESWRGFTGQGSFVPGDVVHPYDQKNGGPCATEMDFFTAPEARRMWRNRLRYAVARWGWSTHILAWEFWNEINCVFGYKNRSQDMIDWTAAMGDYLDEVDPWGHLVVNSLGSFEVDDRLWSLPELDFAQVHGYRHPKAIKESTELGQDMAAFVPYWVHRIEHYDKPALFAEFGLVRENWGPSPLMDQDQDGVHLHNGLWSAIMAGACGTAMLWWWDNYVDRYDLYGQFGAVARYTRDVPWTTAGFKPVEAEADSPDVRALGLVGHDRALLWVQNRRHTWWHKVNGEGMPPVAEATVTLTGLPDGRYTVEWYDTWQGTVTATTDARVEGGKLALVLSDLARDVAAKIRPLPAQP